ncbi:MAG: prolipoprotein diacylglyceryl transferase family protein [Terracidiphilus sp.]
MLFVLLAISWPTALQVVTIVSPDLVTSVALLAALGYAVRSARLSGLNVRAMYWAVVSSLLAGLWGAHLLWLLVHGWSGGPVALFEFVQGGKSLFGGLVFGGLAAGLYFRYRKLPGLAYADAAIPAVALGYAIGRIGCFLNGDDYGTLTHVRWAVVYPPGTEAYQAHLERGWISPADLWSLPVHPVQLYASALGLVLFVIFANWRPKWEGGRLCAYLILYGFGRFFTEYLRGDFRKVLGPFSLPQLFSLFFIVLGVQIWLQRRREQPVEALVTAAPDQARSCQWRPL